jgi:hypothetical protein
MIRSALRGGRVKAWSLGLALAGVAGVVSSLVACGGDTPPPKTANVAPGGSKDPNDWPADDRTMCDWRNHPELEVVETAGPGALRPNVRRVYKILGERDTRHKVLICREIDSNLDGIKDVVRTFNEKGEAQTEQSDTDYDGKPDVWIKFVGGRIAEEDVDTRRTGKPDVWKFYIDGQLSRVRRSTHCPNNKPDTWEVYAKGRLERVGTDQSCDGHVDRWDRDTEKIAREEEQAKKAEEALADGGAHTPLVVGADAAVLEAGLGGDAGDAGKDANK